MNNLAIKLLMFMGFLLFNSASVLASNKVEDVRIWPSPDNTRVVFDLASEPEYTYFSLKNPHRLVIDFKNTKRALDFNKINSPKSLIKNVRQSQPKNKKSVRVVLDLTKEVNSRLFKLTPYGPYGHRLVVNLQDDNADTPSNYVRESANGKRDIVVAIDAGHGGHDPGAVGANGTYEKEVAFAISKKLAAMVNAERGMVAKMTRDGDYYLTVGRRSEIARREKADVLISIHADAFTTSKPRGASVWVLTLKRANTEIGRWLERSEQHSELLGGAAEVIQDTQSEKYLAKALLDMSMDHALTSGYDLSTEVIRELNKVTRVHQKTTQLGNFGVLKSPDIPSILVEAGFMSNPHEERLLNDPAHQRKIAKAVFNATKRFFSRQAPDGTLYASLRGGRREHVVERGDSLSVLAQRYNVTVNGIKQANNLSRSHIRIGQTLKIPAS